MTLKDFQPLFNALENEKRIDIFQYITAHIFVSKSDIAKEFNLKRASLNHHLDKLLEVSLIYEVVLILEGRRQTFLLPSVILHPSRLLEVNQEYKDLKVKIDAWSKRNITLHSWSNVRSDLDQMKIEPHLIEAVQARLFPSLGNRSSSLLEFCYICRNDSVKDECAICKNLICATHTHEIERNDQDKIILCPNCVERYFG